MAHDRRPDSRLRVLIVTGTSLGGSATYIQHLVEGLHGQIDFGLAYGSGSPQDHRFEALACRRWSLPIDTRAGAVQTLRLARMIAGLIDRWDPDVIHTNTTAGGLAGRLAAGWHGASARVVHTLHAYASHDLVPASRRWALRLLERGLDRWTGGYVCVSAAMRRFGLDRSIFAGRNQVVIHNTIGRYPVGDRGTHRREVRAELDLDATAALVVFAGRLERQKGVEVLLDALASTNCTGAHLALCGSGALGDDLIARAGRLGIADRVHFLGWRDDTARWIAAADVMALPSRWESFGLVNLEAMAWGVPICASAVDGIPEVVTDGANGILVPPEDPAALAAAIGSLLADDDLRRRLGSEGQQRYRQAFSYPRHLARHAATYAVTARRADRSRARPWSR